MEAGDKNKVNCLKCRHYVVTWNPQLPHACKLLGFKSKTLPSVGAYNATGEACKGFEPKNGKGSSASKVNEQGVIVSIRGNKKR